MEKYVSGTRRRHGGTADTDHTAQERGGEVRDDEGGVGGSVVCQDRLTLVARCQCWLPSGE